MRQIVKFWHRAIPFHKPEMCPILILRYDNFFDILLTGVRCKKIDMSWATVFLTILHKRPTKTDDPAHPRNLIRVLKGHSVGSQ